eukprot:Em0002g738a
MVRDLTLFLLRNSRDARSDLAAADKRVADADKRLADADKRLADARHDLAAARHDLAVAEAQKERDEDDMKQCKQDIKQCKEYVKQYRQHVATTLKLLNAAQEAALELYPSSRKRKREERVDEAYKARKDRWNKLNEVLNKRKKSQTAETCGFSYVSWSDVHPIFGHFRELEFNKQDLPNGIKDQLLGVIKVYDDLTKSSSKTESQVFVFINAVLCYLCKDLKNDLVFTYEGDVSGSYVIADGIFELIMSDRKNGSKICLAEAKKDNMDQGEAQCLVGCEAVSDSEAKVNVYGIVSNYIEWIFLASKNDGIYRYKTPTIGCDGFYPSDHQSFERVLVDIYSFVCMVINNK